MDDINKFRFEIEGNIRRQFGVDIQKSQEEGLEKARGGVYSDTAQNRKLGRVGQKYGAEGKQEEGGEKKTKGEIKKMAIRCIWSGKGLMELRCLSGV